MTPCEWIVCENSGRWATALRTASVRQPNSAPDPAIREVRTLEELSARLAEHPSSIALVEVRPKNFSSVLDWLAAARDRYHRARFVALILDAGDGPERDAICDAMRAIGALDTAVSPRHLHRLLGALRRHVETRRQLAPVKDYTQVEDWALAALPWQEASRPVG